MNPASRPIGATGDRRTFGEGPLARAAALVYTLLIVELLFLLTAGPGLIALVLLDHDATVLWVVAGVAALWMVNALVITSLFAFRAVDVARLAAYFLFHRAGVTLGAAGLVFAAVAVTAVSSEAVTALLASILVAALLLTARPMTAEVEARFTA